MSPSSSAQPNAPSTDRGPDAEVAGSRHPSDRVWDAIREFGRIDSPRLGMGPLGPEAPRPDRVAAFLEQANQIDAFRRQFPSHAARAEARRLESLCLSWAALHGDRSQEARRRALIPELRNDPGLPPARRFEAVALNAQADLAQTAFASFGAQLEAQEKVARALAAEFPSVDAGYETLLAIAAELGPQRGATLADEIVRGAAPGRIKQEARVLTERFALVGRSLTAITEGAGVSLRAETFAGRTVIVYSWSATDQASLRLGKELRWLLPDSHKIGVNLDSDSEAARRIAAREELPGDHHYVHPGGRVAAALAMNRSGLAYVADGRGILREINGSERLAEKLAGLGR